MDSTKIIDSLSNATQALVDIAADSASVADTVAAAVEAVVDVVATADTAVVADTAAAVVDVASINAGGVLFMAFSWCAIIALNIFCFRKILMEPEEKIVGPLEVEAEIDEMGK